MNGKYQSGKRRAQIKLPGGFIVGDRQSDGNQPPGNEIKENAVGSVEYKIRQVIAGRIQSPNEVVKSVGHPTQRLVGSHVKRGKHPAQLIPSQAAVVRVIDQIFIVVPLDEMIP